MWSTCYYCQIFNKTLIFSDRFLTSTQISNFVIVHPVAAEWFHVDRQTDRQTERQDRTKLTVTLCSCVYTITVNLFPGLARSMFGTMVRLIFCHSFKPIFFNLGLLRIFECVCPNCGRFGGKVFHIWKIWVYQHHISGYSHPSVRTLLFLCLTKHHTMKMCEWR